MYNFPVFLKFLHQKLGPVVTENYSLSESHCGLIKLELMIPQPDSQAKPRLMGLKPELFPGGFLSMAHFHRLFSTSLFFNSLANLTSAAALHLPFSPWAPLLSSNSNKNCNKLLFFHTCFNILKNCNPSNNFGEKSERILLIILIIILMN